MRKITFGILLIGTILSISACGNKTASAIEDTDSVVDTVDSVVPEVYDSLKMEKAEYIMSNKFVEVKVAMEIPADVKGVSSVIRKNIMALLDKNIPMQADYGEGNRVFASYSGKVKNLQVYCDYYGKQIYHYETSIAKQEYESNIAYNTDEENLTDEAQEAMDAEIIQWNMDVNVSKVAETDHYVVFNENVYGYTGGAHGGIYGLGAITFDSKTGAELKTFLKPGSVKQIQPILKKGLIQYFTQNGERVTEATLKEYLLLEGNLIPLPKAYRLHPSIAGIVFEYAQYEIAAYAAGMPSFVVPYDEIKPYLNDEAIKVLGL